MEREVGRVSWFNRVKGFGFISREGQKDIFVHYSSINREGYKILEDNQIVEFDVETGPEGRTQATNVTVKDGSPES